MKKYSIFAFAALFMLMSGAAFAAGIPQTADPKNLPVIWTESVYNGSGSDIGTGQVVVWDFDTADVTPNEFDDMCNWVKVASTTADPWIAGVVPITVGISNGNRGVIVIKGPAVCDDGNAGTTGGTQLTANDIVGISTSSAGEVAEISAVTHDGSFLGVCIKASAAQQGYTHAPLVYVNPTLFYDD